MKQILLTSPARRSLTFLGAGLGALAGVAVLLRASNETQEPKTASLSWGKPIQVASGGGHRGPWEMNESDFRYVDDATVNFAGEGQVTVAWVDQARKDIFFQRYGSDGKAQLESPTNVSKTSEVFSWLPRVAVAPDDPDKIMMLWQEIVFSGGTHGGEIFFARSTDGGRSFSEPLNLSQTKAGAGKGRLTEELWDNGSLDLAVGPGGEIYAAWTEYEGNLWFRRSTDGGQSFSKALRISGAEGDSPARGPSLAVASDGKVHLAWAVGESEEADIHFTTSEDGGKSFAQMRVVLKSDRHSDAPEIATDSEGTVHLVYSEGNHVRYSRWKPGAEKFSEAFSQSRRVSDRGHYPEVALDQQGRVYLLWEKYVGRRVLPQELEFTYSTDGGDSFKKAIEVPEIAGPELGFNGSQQGNFTNKLAVSASGAIAIANSTFLPGQESHIWLLRGRIAS